jgi:uncharacterized protein (DUF1778 family)
MPRNKCETLSIRTTGEIKELIRQAADREHRSVASMIEILILDHAELHLSMSGAKQTRSKKPKAK